MDCVADDAGEAALWSRFKAGGDTRARDELHRRYASWASAIARRVHRRFPLLPADRNDFVQNANLGLLEAIDRFEPGRGVEFQAYAMARVRGSVFNGIRSIVGAGATTAYSDRLDSLRESDGDPLDNVVNAIVGLGLGYMLDDAANQVFSDTFDGLMFAENRQAASRLVDAVGRLPRRQRMIVVRHYFEFVPFIDMADEWGITKGRVSQLHRSALDTLRQMMAG